MSKFLSPSSQQSADGASLGTPHADRTTALSASGKAAVSDATMRAPLGSYDGLRITLGLVLLAAAVSKGYDLAMPVVPEMEIFGSRWPMFGVVSIELVLALLLLSGLCQHLVRAFAVVFFAGATLVSFSKILAGESSCGCFGIATVSPWFALTFSMLALVLLVICRSKTVTTAHLRAFHFRGVVILPLVLVIAVTSVLLMRSSSLSTELVVEHRHLDLGKIYAQHGFDWDIPVTNVTARDIDVTAVAVSCSCSHIEPDAIRIPAGETRNIRLRLDLTPPDESMQESPLDFATRITLQLNGATTTTASWTLYGEVHRHPIVATPNYLFFDIPFVPGRDFPAGSILLQSSVPLRHLAFHTEPANEAHIECISRPGSKTYVVQVIPYLRSAGGRFEFMLFANGTTIDGEALPAISIPVAGEIDANIFASPRSILWGAQKCGAITRETLTLESHDGCTFSVTDVRTQDPGLNVTASSPFFGQTASKHCVVVEYNLTRQGSITGDIVFTLAHDNAFPTQELLSLKIPYVIYGVAGD